MAIITCATPYIPHCARRTVKKKLFHVITHTVHALVCLATIARDNYLHAICLRQRREKNVFLTVIRFIFLILPCGKVSKIILCNFFLVFLVCLFVFQGLWESSQQQSHFHFL